MGITSLCTIDDTHKKVRYCLQWGNTSLQSSEISSIKNNNIFAYTKSARISEYPSIICILASSLKKRDKENSITPYIVCFLQQCTKRIHPLCRSLQWNPSIHQSSLSSSFPRLLNICLWKNSYPRPEKSCTSTSWVINDEEKGLINPCKDLQDLARPGKQRLLYYWERTDKKLRVKTGENMTKAPKFRRHFILPRSWLNKFSAIFQIFLHFLKEIAMEAPRVNASMLSQYTGKLVCLVGNVTEVRLMANLCTFYSAFSLVFDHPCWILAHKEFFSVFFDSWGNKLAFH